MEGRMAGDRRMEEGRLEEVDHRRIRRTVGAEVAGSAGLLGTQRRVGSLGSRRSQHQQCFLERRRMFG